MKATHREYLHPKHLRVEQGGDVYCVSPSSSDHARLWKQSLPVFGDRKSDLKLPRHSSSWTAFA